MLSAVPETLNSCSTDANEQFTPQETTYYGKLMLRRTHGVCLLLLIEPTFCYYCWFAALRCT